MLLLAFTIVPGVGSAALLPSSVAYLLFLWHLASSQSRRHSLGALTTGLIRVGVITAGERSANYSQRSHDVDV